jgi:Zn-dependent peptidase ImmA (M78 family)
LLHATEQAERWSQKMVFHLGLKPPVDVDRIIRHLGIVLHHHPFCDEVCGFHFKTDAGCHIVVNSLHHPHRQKTSAIHEIAHFLLNRMEDNRECTRLLVRPDPRECERCGVCAHDPRVIESFCTRFAAALQVPDPLLRPMMELNRMPRRLLIDPMARLFDVSYKLMELRMDELGLLGDEL